MQVGTLYMRVVGSGGRSMEDGGRTVGRWWWCVVEQGQLNNLHNATGKRCLFIHLCFASCFIPVL